MGGVSRKHGAWLDVDGSLYRPASASCSFYDRVGIGRATMSATMEVSRDTIQIAREAHRRLVRVKLLYVDDHDNNRVMFDGFITGVSIDITDTQKTMTISSEDLINVLLSRYQMLFVKPDSLIKSFSSPQASSIYGSSILDPLTEIITRAVDGPLKTAGQFIDALLYPILNNEDGGVLSSVLSPVINEVDLRGKIKEIVSSDQDEIFEAMRSDLLMSIISTGGVNHGSMTSAHALLDEFLRTVIYKMTPIPAYDGGFIVMPDLFGAVPPPCNEIHDSQSNMNISIDTSQRVTRTIGIIPFTQMLGDSQVQGEGGVSDYAMLPSYEPSPSLEDVGAASIIEYFKTTLDIEQRMLPLIDFENMPRWVMLAGGGGMAEKEDLRELSRRYVEWSHARKFLMIRQATFNGMSFAPDLATGFSVDFKPEQSLFKSLKESPFNRVFGTINSISHYYTPNNGWTTGISLVGVEFDDGVEEDSIHLPPPIGGAGASMVDEKASASIYADLGLTKGRSGSGAI